MVERSTIMSDLPDRGRYMHINSGHASISALATVN